MILLETIVPSLDSIVRTKERIVSEFDSLSNSDIIRRLEDISTTVICKKFTVDYNNLVTYKHIIETKEFVNKVQRDVLLDILRGKEIFLTTRDYSRLSNNDCQRLKEEFLSLQQSKPLPIYAAGKHCDILNSHCSVEMVHNVIKVVHGGFIIPL